MSETSFVKSLQVPLKIMKRFLTLPLILFAVSHFGTTQVFAQKKVKPKEVIIIEFLAPKHKEFSKNEIQINRTSREKSGVGG